MKRLDWADSGRTLAAWARAGVPAIAVVPCAARSTIRCEMCRFLRFSLPRGCARHQAGSCTKPPGPPAANELPFREAWKIATIMFLKFGVHPKIGGICKSTDRLGRDHSERFYAIGGSEERTWLPLLLTVK